MGRTIMTDSATERLDRILYILPLAIRTDGVTLQELARALSCDATDILRDLGEITARAFYHAPGAASQLQILIEDDRVEIWSPDQFRRPARLTPREGLALGLGLRILAAEAPAARRPEILALARRLEDELVTSFDLASAASPETSRPISEAHEALPVYDGTFQREEADLAPDAELLGEPLPHAGIEPPSARVRRLADFAAHFDSLSLDVGEDGFRSDVADAVTERLHCRVLYLKPGAAEPELRTIAPYRLVYASGLWYVLAHDAGRDGVRAFRMDRMLGVEVTTDRFETPADFDASQWLTSSGGVYRSPDDEITATVHYSARIARWIEERFPCEAAPDNGVLVRHRVADPNWIVRHVLQYGGDAHLVEPAPLRDRVARAALRQTA
jgi:predicted DNA-binding transcriptional regulator YafY